MKKILLAIAASIGRLFAFVATVCMLLVVAAGLVTVREEVTCVQNPPPAICKQK